MALNAKRMRALVKTRHGRPPEEPPVFPWA
jgi:hypothetical protein